MDTWLPVVIGAVFGILLHRGRVTNYNVIVNQFRFRDFTVLKIMLTAIVVGGVGVTLLQNQSLAVADIKSANMLAVILGGLLFGVGMVIYGYCPGTGFAAIGAGSVHALVGFVGMIIGGALYAFSFDWLNANIINVWQLGKKRLPDVTGLGEWVWLAILAAVALAVFALLHALVSKPAKTK